MRYWVLDSSGRLDSLIARARQRHIFHHLISRVMLATALVFACIILLLVLGTYILSPYWLALVFCASLAISWYTSRKQLLSPYQVAQVLDRRLNLNDSLSTAVHFTKSGSGPIVASQRALAEDQARSADLRAGLPFAPPRSLYASALLGVLAMGIFGVRFGVTHSLDLRPALVHMPFSGSTESDSVAANKKKPGPKTGRERSKEDALSYDPWESKVIDQTGAPESALNTIETPDVNNPATESPGSVKAAGAPTADPNQEAGDSAEAGEKTAAGSDQAGNDTQAPDKDGGSHAGKQSSSQDNQNSSNNPSNAGENSSLSEKMRDALANLMSKLKMNQKPGEGKQGQQQGQNGAQSAKQQQGKDDKGSQMPGKPQADGMSSPDAQGDQEGESSDKAQSAQNKTAKGSDKPQSQDGKSGIGKQDGDKSAREAEQLAAMGKISEIIGKRSAAMTGEVMVEVASGKQQLKTQYSQKHATHGESGGEINRDEVPLAYQQYVQQYFEEIRKVPATSAKQPVKR